MQKEEARIIYREKRKRLSLPEKAKLDDLLLIQLQTINLPFVHTLLTYSPIQEANEPNTQLFTDYLAFKNPTLQICYPRTDFSQNSMEAIETNDNIRFTLTEKNIYEPVGGNIVSPEELDMVLVPMLICDKKGFRAGYGKGFYDRYLSACRADCLKIGFSYFEPIPEIADTHEFDIPLNICITPQNVYVFNFF